MWARLSNNSDRAIVIGIARLLASLLVYTQASCGERRVTSAGAR